MAAMLAAEEGRRRAAEDLARAEAAFARTLHTLRAEFGTKAPFLDVPLQRSDPAQVALATQIRARAASLMRAEESAR
jgi:hypothetical protein